jgi:hypothetical protein
MECHSSVGTRFAICLSLASLAVGLPCSQLRAADEGKALVHIISSRPEHIPGGGEVKPSGFGAGFFIESDGLLLTAYHVVQGGVTLDVYDSSGGRCLNPVVVAYDEHRDLAELRCKPATGSASVLQIADSFEPLPLQGGIIYGHPNTKLNQRTPVDFPSEYIIKSDHYFIGVGEDLFAEPAQDLIEIQAVIEPGMSGGPVLLQGKVIGVVSGSQGSGGMQQGWAIPARVSRQLKPAASTDLSMLPPVSILRGGRIPRSFLKVGIPKDRLILISENASILASTRIEMEQWRLKLESRGALIDLSNRLRKKKHIELQDVCRITETVWAIDHIGPYRYKDRCGDAYSAAYQDAVYRLFRETPAGEIGPPTPDVERDEASIILSTMASVAKNVDESVDEEFRENRKMAGQIDHRVGKSVLEKYRLRHIFDDDFLSAPADLRNTIGDLAELEDLREKWRSAVLTLIDLRRPYEEGASKLRQSGKQFYSLKTGAAAEQYIADQLLYLDTLSQVQTKLMQVVDIELLVLEKTVSLNGNPNILELRLETP